jgi:hypothetical protein
MRPLNVAMMSLLTLAGCEKIGTLPGLPKDWSIPSLPGTAGASRQLRLESNKAGAAFCLGGAPLLSSDPRVTVYAGDRVYVVTPAPEQTSTVVAVKEGFFPFVDTATPQKVRLQFDFFDRNRCTRSSGGQTCVTSAMISELGAFRQFCSEYP